MSAQRQFDTFFDVEPTHPSLPGHFPGDPILPGVVILDRVLEAAEDRIGLPLLVTALPQAKFVSPLRPGDQARVRLCLNPPSLRFELHNGETLVAKGTFSVRIVLDEPA
jgi:3-hydroxymyristoyl/3-hydroxydecanoyl-(acyl carrier protein) dehydratase